MNFFQLSSFLTWLRRGLRSVFPLCGMNREIWEISYLDFADMSLAVNTDGPVLELFPLIQENST